MKSVRSVSTRTANDSSIPVVGVQRDLRELDNRRNDGVRLGAGWQFNDAVKLRIQVSQDETEMTVRAGLQWAF